MARISLTPRSPKATIQAVNAFAKAHKALAGLIALSLVSAIYGTVKAAQNPGALQYVYGSVHRANIVSTVSGTGSVTATNQIDVKAKASGAILYISAKTGESLPAGGLIASIDPSDAGLSLESAEVQLQKLLEPSDAATVIAAKQALADAKTSETNAYNDALSETASVFLNLPSVEDGLNSMLYTNSGYLSDQSVTALGTTATSYRMKAGVSFDNAKREFDALNTRFQSVKSSSDQTLLLDLYAATQNVLRDFAQALKDATLAVSYVKDITSNSPDPTSARLAQTSGTNAQTSLTGWSNDIASHLNTLTTELNTVKSAPALIAQRQAALDKLERGADPLDVRSQELAVAERERAYADYFARSPIAGVVGRISVKKGDTVSTGSVIATIITKEKVAEVSLNEVDAAKVKVGDKVKLTFDAVEGLTLDGTVSDLDLVGTVSQGVVTYNAKVAFDNDDARVLPGMSANADIIVDSKEDTIVIPSSAVKTDRRGTYVLVADPASATPKQVSVTVGLTNDTESEITEGLSEGEQIVVRTVSATTAATTQQAPSIFGGGSPRGSSGAVRFAR